MGEVTDKAVYDRVAAIVGHRLQLDQATIDPDAEIVEQFGAESIDVLSIVAQLESQFDVEIAKEVIPSVRTVRGIAELLSAHLRGEAAGR